MPLEKRSIPVSPRKQGLIHKIYICSMFENISLINVCKYIFDQYLQIYLSPMFANISLIFTFWIVEYLFSPSVCCWLCSLSRSVTWASSSPSSSFLYSFVTFSSNLRSSISDLKVWSWSCRCFDFSKYSNFSFSISRDRACNNVDNNLNYNHHYLSSSSSSSSSSSIFIIIIIIICLHHHHHPMNLHIIVSHQVVSVGSSWHLHVMTLGGREVEPEHQTNDKINSPRLSRGQKPANIVEGHAGDSKSILRMSKTEHR